MRDVEIRDAVELDVTFRDPHVVRVRLYGEHASGWGHLLGQQDRNQTLVRAEIKYQCAAVESVAPKEFNLVRKFPIFVVPLLSHPILNVYVELIEPVAMADDLLGKRPDFQVVFRQPGNVSDGCGQIRLS
jgi:hypothetical protein